MCAGMSRTLLAYPYPRIGLAAAVLALAGGLALAAASPASAARRPHAPDGLRVVTVTTTSVTLDWDRTTRRYNVLKNGDRVATTRRTRYTFENLGCNRTYNLGVRA